MFNSILDFETENLENLKFSTNCLQDLNLDQVIRDLQAKRKGYNIAELYQRYPKNYETIFWRQEILEDLKRDGLFQGLDRFSSYMSEARKYMSYSSQSDYPLQKKKWFFDGMCRYAIAWNYLYEALQEHIPKSRGLKLLYDYMTTKEKNMQFQEWKEETFDLQKQFDKMYYSLTVVRDRFSVKLDIPLEDYSDKMRIIFPDKCRPRNEFCEKETENRLQNLIHSGLEIVSPFEGIQLSYMEHEIIEVFYKCYPQTFQQLEDYQETWKAGIDEVMIRLEDEIQYYLSFIEYEKEMQSYGFVLTKPSIMKDGPFVLERVYDLALAGKNTETPEKIISNVATYREGEKFFVLTGPNQGGKTTYARSLGQAVYLAMMGLDVPASNGKLPYFSGVLTHFSVEESMETGQGKLMEELTRLVPMMEHQNARQFVIINELFTTAATYDAYIMGRKVIDHFIHCDCTGIYVTHIQELAEEKNGVASLMATVDDKDYHKRTYRILRKAAEGIGYAGDIVEKYNLTYEQLKNRMCKEGLV